MLRATYEPGEPLPAIEIMTDHVRALVESHETLARQASQLSWLTYRLALAIGQVGSAGDFSGDPDDLVTVLIGQRNKARVAAGDADARLEWQRKTHEFDSGQLLALREALESIALLATDLSVAGDPNATRLLLDVIRLKALTPIRRPG